MAEQKMSRMALTAMVVGGMVGAGIFSLPRTFANATGPLGAVIAWHFAIKRIRPLARLVIMNVPHPICFGREIAHWHQKKKSWSEND